MMTDKDSVKGFNKVFDTAIKSDDFVMWWDAFLVSGLVANFDRSKIPVLKDVCVQFYTAGIMSWHMRGKDDE